ncbi:YdcF family protein [Moraxella sp. FZFQ2102]|uniref:YdcF family protein n=1 Tax=Moraxella sp. FZFQ2102 TaxID=2953752 RepID=UPI00209C30EA|nr:YdcF family protein [Moraxella sp. FZFQ2102]USZ15220.1 YdcF family protein [Moraxella sp. FZFQ2102]
MAATHKPLPKAVKWLGVAGLCTAIGALSTVTPIFATVGTGLLNLYPAITLPQVDDKPTAIIVLGGGLTRNSAGKITLNHYSQSRADQALKQYNTESMPIITSGAESPWLRDYLVEQDANVVILSDNASMNTCENANFTAKLLNYHELPKTAYLVTDRYHMARARRQFAKAGIATIANPAPLAIAPSWLHPKDNLIHTRRTVYEMVALARDIFAPQENCRTADAISIEEISTPRRKPKLFF